MRKLITLIAGLCCMAGSASAQSKPIVLFPDGAPGETVKLVERVEVPEWKTGGKDLQFIRDVSEPTITVYHSMSKKKTSPAMVVCPGGAYEFLSYNLEGEEICEWLNKLGFTAVLLKYRVPRREGREKHEAPLQDVQRALSYVRAHSTEWNIYPDRIGVMGFSAGGHLSTMASTHFNERTYPYVDECDKVSSRPDFCLLVYPAYIDGENFSLAPEVTIQTDTPPTMFIQAEDDKDYINSSIFYYYALKQAGIPAWMHLYSTGGHGYGLRNTGCAVNEWTKRAEAWFKEIKVIR